MHRALTIESLMSKWLGRASYRHEMYEVIGSNQSQVEFGVCSTSV